MPKFDIGAANKLKEDGKYLETSNIFKKLYDHNTHNNYYLQQQSLFLSKVDGGKSKERLIQAEKIINRLKPLESFDNETTGIYGGIEKRLYNITGNSIYLDNAINAYNRGFIIRKDYYNGENVVNCLIYKILNEKNTEKIIAIKSQIEEINNDVLNLAHSALSKQRDIDFWIYGTLSNSCLIDTSKANMFKDYKEAFLDSIEFNWQKETFEKTEKLRNKYLNFIKKINEIKIIDNNGNEITDYK